MDINQAPVAQTPYHTRATTHSPDFPIKCTHTRSCKRTPNTYSLNHTLGHIQAPVLARKRQQAHSKAATSLAQVCTHSPQLPNEMTAFLKMAGLKITVTNLVLNLSICARFKNKEQCRETKPDPFVFLSLCLSSFPCTLIPQPTLTQHQTQRQNLAVEYLLNVQSRMI